MPRDLYQLNSAYGSESDLRDLIATFHEHNIKVIADIVINHRCAHQQGPDGKWNKFGGRLAWDASAICSNNPAYGGRGNPKQGDDYAAAPNVDHSQERIRQDITTWMKYLRQSIGFDGWRFDFVRGYPGQYCKMYVDETVPEMAFGEYWDSCDYTDGVLNYNQDAHRSVLMLEAVLLLHHKILSTHATNMHIVCCCIQHKHMLYHPCIQVLVISMLNAVYRCIAGSVPSTGVTTLVALLLPLTSQPRVSCRKLSSVASTGV